MSPEYRRLFAYKKAYKRGGGYMHSRTPLATLLNYILQLFNLYHVMFHSVCFHSFFEDKNVSPQCAKTTNFQACFLARCNYDTLAQKSVSLIPSRAFQRIIYLYFDLLLPGSTESRQKKRVSFDPEAEVVVDPRGDSRVDPQITLTML